MFQFDLKHGYYHINKKKLLRIFVENWWKSLVFCSYNFASRTWFCPVSVGKDYSPFSNLLVQKFVKGIIILGWWPESLRIISLTQFSVQLCTKNFAKIRFYCEPWKTKLGATGIYARAWNRLRFWELKRFTLVILELFHISYARTI